MDQTYNESFHQKMQSIQYKAALAITGSMRGTSREKLYQELDIKSLHKRRWYRKLCYFFKIFKGQSPEYLFRILPSVRKTYKQELMIRFPFSLENIIFYKFFFSINCH